MIEKNERMKSNISKIMENSLSSSMRGQIFDKDSDRMSKHRI